MDPVSDRPTGGGTRLERLAGAAIAVVGGVGVVALMLLTVADALLRSFANAPILGANDLTQVILAVVVAASVPLCVASDRAVAITALVDRMRPAAGGLVRRAAYAASASVLAYLAWRCFVNGGEAAMFGETTMLLRIPYGPFYYVLSAGFGVSAVLFAVGVLRGRLGS
ncbi:TRAP transporter small permease [Salinarimonas chemoclinalis]|uniref:TRAP transporter small permease n=1 Tax=Salinarimonas chemoclinalis TaxID=3241599 RepID=UPI003557D57A